MLGPAGGEHLANLNEANKLLDDEGAHTAVRTCWYVSCCILGILIGSITGFFVFEDPGGSSDGTEHYTAVMRVSATLVGLLSGLLVAFLMSGDFGREMNSGVRDIKQATSLLMPGVAQTAIYGHPQFTLFVTVHHAKNVSEVSGLVPAVAQGFKTYDAYVTLTCGDNPAKATCVRRDETFNETFKLLVAVTDTHLVVHLKDQDVVGHVVIGVAFIKIDEIINSGFPVFKSYNLHDAEATRSGQVTLSFDWGDDFSRDKLEYLRETHPVEFQRRQALRQESLKQQTVLLQSVMRGSVHASQVPARATHGPPASGDLAAGPQPRMQPYGTFEAADCKRVLQGSAGP